MKSKCSACHLVLGVSLLLSVLTCAAEPRFLVQWDGAYLDRQAGGDKLNWSGETILNNAEEQPEGVGFLYSEDSPISPSSAGYDSTKPSAVFYGALEVRNPTRAKTQDILPMIRSLNTVVANYGKNMMNLSGNDPEEGGISQVQGLVFWKLKDCPLESARGGGLKWSDIQCLSIDVSKINSKLSSFRFAVQSGGKWYLAESAGLRTGWTIMHDTTWAEWPVAASFPLPPMPELFPVSSGDLKNITALGVAFSGVSDAPGHNAVFAFKAFYAEASPGFK